MEDVAYVSSPIEALTNSKRWPRYCDSWHSSAQVGCGRSFGGHCVSHISSGFVMIDTVDPYPHLLSLRSKETVA